MTLDPSTIDPQVLARVEQLAHDRNRTVESLLLNAIEALEDLEVRRSQLKAEIHWRLERTGQGLSQPLDVEVFRTEALRRRGKQDSPPGV